MTPSIILNGGNKKHVSSARDDDEIDKIDIKIDMDYTSERFLPGDVNSFYIFPENKLNLVHMSYLYIGLMQISTGTDFCEMSSFNHCFSQGRGIMKACHGGEKVK